MDHAAGLTGGGERFPHTRHSVVEAVGNPDAAVRERAFDTLIRAYWKPVYYRLRIQWNATADDAKDLTQEFFLRAMSHGFFDSYDRGRAKFRTFLRTCLDRFVANERKAAGRLKRGGGVTIVALDFDDAERFLQGRTGAADPDRMFHDEWVRSVFNLAVERLRVECEESGKDQAFQLFLRYDIDAAGGDTVTYRDLADRFDLPVTQVTNLLALARGRFREQVLSCLRELSGSEEEFRDDAATLLGVRDHA